MSEGLNQDFRGLIVSTPQDCGTQVNAALAPLDSTINEGIRCDVMMERRPKYCGKIVSMPSRQTAAGFGGTLVEQNRYGLSSPASCSEMKDSCDPVAKNRSVAFCPAPETEQATAT